MQFRLFLSLATILSISRLPPPAGATCYGAESQRRDYTLTCGEQYSSCVSCIADSDLSCQWCTSLGTCVDGTCPETPYDGWCPPPPADTTTTVTKSPPPPFDGQRCINVSYEYRLCTQKVDLVGCSEDFFLSYCSPQYNETGLLLCDGASVDIMNGDDFFAASVGSIEKNPNGVRVHYSPDIWYSGCYQFHYEPITDAIICLALESGDSSTVLNYTLAPVPAPTTAPVPTAPPSSPTTSAPTAPAVPTAPVSTTPVTTTAPIPTTTPVPTTPVTTAPNPTTPPVLPTGTPVPTSAAAAGLTAVSSAFTTLAALMAGGMA